MTVVRRLFDSARITLFVATIGVAQLVTVLVINVPRVEGFGAAFPTPFTGTWQLGGAITVHGPQVVALVVDPAGRRSALGWFLNRTIWGIAITADRGQPRRQPPGRAEHRGRCRRWCGCSPARSPASPPCSPRRCARRRSANLAQSSGIQLLVIALAVALLARMRSMLVAVVAGVVVGVVERIVFYNWAEPVRPHGVRALRRSCWAGCWSPAGVRPAATAPGPCRAGWRRCPTGCGRTCSSAACRGCPRADRARRAPSWSRSRIDTNAKYFLYSRMALIAIVVVSVTILTGWAGQLSLAQFALAGLGAMTMAGADLHLNLQFLPALGLAIVGVRRGRGDHGHPVVPGPGHVPGDRHPGVRQRRLRAGCSTSGSSTAAATRPATSPTTCASARST